MVKFQLRIKCATHIVRATPYSILLDNKTDVIMHNKDFIAAFTHTDMSERVCNSWVYALSLGLRRRLVLEQSFFIIWLTMHVLNYYHDHLRSNDLMVVVRAFALLLS